MRRNSILYVLAFLCVFLTGCQEINKNCPAKNQYYIQNVKRYKPSLGLTLLDIKSYQQTTEYTCGPSSVLTVLHYYKREGNEMKIAAEMGTDTTTGTTPEQMIDWLNKNGFKASWHEHGTLDTLRNNLSKNKPTIVEWIDWGGHWVVVVGYDTRNTENPMDDVIIFADPYDRHDDNPDGFTWFNAERFYYMWFGELLTGRLMKNIYVDCEPI
jgi:hypothetical protein